MVPECMVVGKMARGGISGNRVAHWYQAEDAVTLPLREKKMYKERFKMYLVLAE